jgi:integrase/recombinase XerD
MSLLAPTLEAFFTERLITQRHASPRTVAAYRDTMRLLLGFAQHQTGKPPCALDFADLDAPLVGAFLQHLEHQRNNNVRTRNARLAAVHSLFRYAALGHPEHAALIQRVLSIPPKRFERAVVSFLVRDEIDALLAAPDGSTWIGRRDQSLLLVAVQAGLRVSELTALRCADVHLPTGAHLKIHGKGRKERCTPLTAQTVAVLRVWLDERDREGRSADPLFPSRRGTFLSADAVEYLVTKYTASAAEHCPSLRGKHVTPHVLRHTSAMLLRQAGVDISVIALWLGHESIESTQIYLHADLALKERALERTAPPGILPGRYRPPDTLLAFLDGL